MKGKRPRKAKRVRKPKAPRPEPITQGSYRQIYEWFFGRLILFKPHDMPISDWLEYLFDFKNRDIVRYICTRPFKMPGLYYASPNIKYQGVGYRKVGAGAEFFVRKDARAPDRVDVEYLAGPGRKDQVFHLTENEWDWAALHCEESERVKK